MVGGILLAVLVVLFLFGMLLLEVLLGAFVPDMDCDSEDATATGNNAESFEFFDIVGSDGPVLFVPLENPMEGTMGGNVANMLLFDG